MNRLSDIELDLRAIVVLAIVTTLALQVIVSSLLRKARDPKKASKRAVGAKDLQHEGLHLARRVQHAATGLLFYGISYTDLGYKLRFEGISTLLVCSLGVYIVHLIRLRNPQVRDFLARTYASILRPRELEGAIPGAFFFLLGVGLSGVGMMMSIKAGNSEEAAMEAWRLGLLYLSFGDPVAAIVGTLMSSRHKKKRVTGNKTWYGSIACFLACLACTVVESNVRRPRPWTMDQDLLTYAVFGGFVGMLAERFAIGDDNLSIPLLSTSAILALQHIEQAQRIASSERLVRTEL